MACQAFGHGDCSLVPLYNDLGPCLGCQLLLAASQDCGEWLWPSRGPDLFPPLLGHVSDVSVCIIHLVIETPLGYIHSLSLPEQGLLSDPLKEQVSLLDL